MKIPCTNCNQHLEIPEELAGQTIECLACKASFAVPALEVPPPATPQVEVTTSKAASTKKCPHCDRVLMASISSQCSWCGGHLNESEMYKSKEEIMDQWKKEQVLHKQKKNVLGTKPFGAHISRGIMPGAPPRTWGEHM